MRDLVLLVASVVLPDRCTLCATWLTLREPGLCSACAAETVGAQPDTPDGVDQIVSAAAFDCDVRESVLALKYKRQVWRARGLGALLAAAPGADGLIAACDGVCHAPTTRQRTRERGFDHAARIATWAVRGTRRRVRYGLLVRDSDSDAQTGRSRAERADAVAAVRATASVQGTWLVIDDVVTTGATLAGCARALREAGASRVLAATVAATPPRRGAS